MWERLIIMRFITVYALLCRFSLGDSDWLSVNMINLSNQDDIKPLN